MKPIPSVAEMIAQRDLAAAREAAATLRRSRERLYPAGARVVVAYRLAHRPHPYRTGSPQQRVPVDEAGRYVGPVDRRSEYYDVETDRLIPITYHLVQMPDGDLYRVLPDDLVCLDLVPVTPVPVPAVVPPACTALVPIPPPSPWADIRHLVEHVAAIVSLSGRGFWTDGGALHLGAQTAYWTIRPSDNRVIIPAPGSQTIIHAVALSLDTLKALARQLQARFWQAEEARLLADVRAAVTGWHMPGVGIVPRNGLIYLESAGHARLRLTLDQRGAVLSDFVDEQRWRDGQQAAQTRIYTLFTSASDLYGRIAQLCAGAA